jgi:hypothetical protein
MSTPFLGPILSGLFGADGLTVITNVLTLITWMSRRDSGCHLLVDEETEGLFPLPPPKLHSWAVLQPGSSLPYPGVSLFL